MSDDIERSQSRLQADRLTPILKRLQSCKERLEEGVTLVRAREVVGAQLETLAEDLHEIARRIQRGEI